MRSNAQQRIIQSLNSNWQFVKSPDTLNANWTSVSIPHTWNAEDVMDDEPGYYRGVGWYKKMIIVPSSWKEKELYLHFEGANQVAVVFVNGKKVGMHIGGYTAFRFRITEFVTAGFNTVEVQLDNSHNKNIAPLSGDFSFYGGIYRDVYLVATEKVHFSMEDHASQGIFISTPNVSASKADVVIKGAFSNYSGKKGKYKITTQLFDSERNEVAKQVANIKPSALSLTGFIQTIKNIDQPKLWSPAHPYLYSAVITLTDAETGKQLDQLHQSLGFRWFSFDAEKGFFLNGKPLKLMGASRHQDYKQIGNALPDALHVKDVELLKKMGANFLRIAHYPQDPAVLEACDRLGILSAEEIPIVNEITETDSFRVNCRQMQTEMIRQHFNHPSVILWGYMNEVLLKIPYKTGTSEREKYLKTLHALALELEQLTKAEDSCRYTMMALNGAFDLYHNAGLTTITQVVGWNLYSGWYSAGLDNFEKFVERHHKTLPEKPLLITEYGADADPRIHSNNPERFDKSLEYGMKFHETYLRVIQAKPYIAGAALWNLAEFNAEHREEAMPHINNKGITTTDRKPKDIYYFYQSHLLSEPFIKIGSKNWNERIALQDSGIDTQFQSTQAVEVYSNQPFVTLKLNGKSVATKATVFNIARFDVPFANGNNFIEALAIINGVEIKDYAEVHFTIVPLQLKNNNVPFTELNINLGDSRIFTDELTGEQWMPEKQYSAGSFGYIGGEVFKVKNGRQSFGTFKNILGTDNDPVYATQRKGITIFQIDVPAGYYEVVLHFAELSYTGNTGLVYNLDTATASLQKVERSFNVLINANEWLKEFGTRGELLPNRAVTVKSFVQAGNEGIKLSFEALKGETILNGIQIRKIN